MRKESRRLDKFMRDSCDCQLSKVRSKYCKLDREGVQEILDAWNISGVQAERKLRVCN